MSGPQGPFVSAQPAPIDARIVKRLLDAGVQPDRAPDHATHLAVYVTDPDGNGLDALFAQL